MILADYKFGSGSVGWLIALLVLVICVVALWFEKSGDRSYLWLILGLALARLL